MEAVWIFMGTNDFAPDFAYTTKKAVVQAVKKDWEGTALRFEKCGDGFTVYDKNAEKTHKLPVWDREVDSADSHVGSIYKVPVIHAKRR